MWTVAIIIIVCTLQIIMCTILATEKFISLDYTQCRQIAKVAQQRAHQNISNDLKVAEVRQEGEKKVLRIKQQLNEEQTKSKQKEEEIRELKRYE